MNYNQNTASQSPIAQAVGETYARLDGFNTDDLIDVLIGIQNMVQQRLFNEAERADALATEAKRRVEVFKKVFSEGKTQVR